MTVNSIQDLISQITALNSELPTLSFDLEQWHRSSKNVTQSIIDFLEDHVNAEGDEEVVGKSLMIQYLYSIDAKDFVLLLRDVLFLSYKTYYTAPYNRQNILKEASSVVSNAIQENAHLLNTIHVQKSIPSQIEEWKFQKSPIAAVVIQLKEILKHMDIIKTADLQLKELDYKLSDFKNRTHEDIEKYYLELVHCRDIITKLPLENESGLRSELKKAVVQIRKILNDIDTKIPIFLYEMHEKIPIELRSGSLVQKKIDVEEQVNYWVEAHLAADVSMFQNLVVQNFQRTYLKCSSILTNDPGTLETESIDELKEIEDHLSKQLREAELHLDKISDSMHGDLRLDRIFSQSEYFLVNPGQIQQSKYRKSSQKLVPLKLVDRGRSIYSSLIKKYIIHDNNFTGVNPAFRFIQSKLIGKQEQNSIFFKKGHIGDSFYVDRPNLMVSIEESITHWKNDLTEHLVICGTHLSGRTAVLSQIENIHAQETVRLEPGKQTEFRGRKFPSSYDLGKSIKEITKSLNFDEQVIILIDDIELWRNEESYLYDNVNSLISTIKNERRNILFVISVNIWMKDFLDTQLSFSAHLPNLLLTNRMAPEGIREVIETRKIATEILNESKRGDSSADERASLVSKLSRHHQFNVGAVLQEWYRINTRDNYKVMDVPNSFKELVLKHKFLLLYLLRFRKTTEAELVQLLGSKTVVSIQEDILKLTAAKVVQRDVLGRLKINDQLIYYIERELLAQTNPEFA